MSYVTSCCRHGASDRRVRSPVPMEQILSRQDTHPTSKLARFRDSSRGISRLDFRYCISLLDRAKAAAICDVKTPQLDLLMRVALVYTPTSRNSVAYLIREVLRLRSSHMTTTPQSVGAKSFGVHDVNQMPDAGIPRACRSSHSGS